VLKTPERSKAGESRVSDIQTAIAFLEERGC